MARKDLTDLCVGMLGSMSTRWLKKEQTLNDNKSPTQDHARPFCFGCQPIHLALGRQEQDREQRLQFVWFNQLV
jgi:hypothetical protein